MTARDSIPSIKSPFDGRLKDIAYFWAMFVIMFALGRTATDNHPRTEVAGLVAGGLPAILTEWAARRGNDRLVILGMIVLFAGGLAFGLLAPIE